MATVSDQGTASRERVNELAASQVDNYRRQPEELISHFNREMSALDGYRGRQLLELLQNADDAGVDANAGCRLLLDINRERLIVANTGRPFSKKGFTSLVISDCSPKQLDRNRFIGCKGLGFRSILTWTDRPLICSGNYEAVFDKERAVEAVQGLAAELPQVAEVTAPFFESSGRWPAAVMRFPAVPSCEDPWLHLARNYRIAEFDTVLVLPLPAGARGDDIHREMLEQISGLPTSSLLFCRYLTRVEVKGDLQRTWDFLREEHVDGHTTVVLERDSVPELWHVYRHAGQVSAEAAAATSGGRRDFEVAVAVPERIAANPEGSLCVFFPTHERLPCALVMHATLETTDDRNRVVAHGSNREVLRHLARHVAEVVERQASKNSPHRALELLAGLENTDPELKSLGFLEALTLACSQRRIFPRMDGDLGPAADVRQVPHSSWLAQLTADVFPDVLNVDPVGTLRDLVAQFKISWFDPATLRDRLRVYLLSVSRSRAGEILGRLLADGQLSNVGAVGMLIGDDGSFVMDGDCFFTPLEKLPPLPGWASNIRFVDDAFQSGLLRGSGATNLRFLATDLSRCDGNVDEYRFDTVSRALIDHVDQGAEVEGATAQGRWRELLRWLFDASSGSRQALPTLSINIVTIKGSLRRATTCYLGPEYPRGQIVSRLYQQFDQDEFAAAPSACGLGDIPIEDAEEFLIAVGVHASPRFEPLRSGPEYQRVLRMLIDRIDYPRTIRDHMCNNADELRHWCSSHGIEGLRVPDRWTKLLAEGDTPALVAFLLSSGAASLAEDRDPHAKLVATVGSERSWRTDASVPIPNVMLMYLRDTAWVPATDGKRRRPSQIMLSSQGVRVLRGVYIRHNIDAKDPLIAGYGGRESLESLLTRLGAASSLEVLSGQSLYELLQDLPERDPTGGVAPGIYRTLIESSVIADDSVHRRKFLASGRMWGRHKGQASYLPVQRLRYNANLTITKAIEAHIPLVDIPRRMSTALVNQIFGIASLTSEEIELSLVGAGTHYDVGSEDANQHLRNAIPFIYALRLARNLDDRGRELNLLRRANLRACTEAQIAATLPDGNIEQILLVAAGERIVIDATLIIVAEYRATSAGFLTFWLGVAELVAELLGRDIADEVGGILRCRSTSEMLEVVRVRLGVTADATLSESRARFADWIKEEEELERSVPPPKPQAPQPPSGGSPTPSESTPSKDEAGESPGGTSAAATKTSFDPVVGPSSRAAKRRKLIVTGLAGGGGGGGRGPIATEPVTFKVVEEFERNAGRFIVPVSHLRGADAFGCDLLSVGSQELRDKVMTDQTISDSDIMRYIEVKGSSSRTGEVELSDNEHRAAQRVAERYWLYRVFVDPERESHFEVATLRDPLNSLAVRTITRFNLAEGSGAEWFALVEEDVEETLEPPPTPNPGAQ